MAAADGTVKITEKGREVVGLQGTQTALSAHKTTNDTIFEAATDARINGLTSTADYVAFHAAQGARPTANAATSSLEGLQHALEITQSVKETALKIRRYITAPCDLVDIR